jgi:hypothetical protein
VASAGQTIQIAKAADWATRSAGKCGQIYGDHLPKLRPSDADFEEHVTDWRYTAFLWIKAQAVTARREVHDTRSHIRFASKKYGSLNLSGV